MDDGPAPVEEDFSSVPIAERLAHKNWKARLHGYESLIKAFAATGSETDSAFKPYLQNPEILKKMRKGVDVVFHLVKYAGEYAARTRETIVPALVDKCLGSTRLGTKQKALALVLEYVEVENSGEGVVRDLLPGVNAKQPKTVAATVTALGDVVRAYGLKVTPPGPILKVLPKIFGHSDKAVRLEGTLLAKSFHSWIGPALQPSLAELKPIALKELNESFEEMEKNGQGFGTARQERQTKAQLREIEAAAMNGAAEGAIEVEEPEEIDPRAFAEEVDIIPKIPGDFQAQVVSSKWKDRKETLDAVSEVVKTAQRIKDSEGMSDLIRALSKRMTDANVMCVMTAANNIGFIAKGIGQPFAKYKSIVIPPMLERYKERKQNVVDALDAGLDDVFATTTFPDITEDLMNSMKSKNPQVQERTLKFFNRCLSTTKIPPNKTDVKPICELLVTLLSDGFEPTRASSQQGLGIMMKIIGERALNPFMEAFEAATIKCKIAGPAPPKPPPPATAAPKRAPPSKVLTEIALNDDSDAPKPLGKPPAHAPSSTAPPSDSFKYKFTPEDAEALAGDLVPSELATDLGDAAWKTRLACLDEAFPQWLESVIETAECEVLFRFLGKKPGWNEKNFQVSAKCFAILNTLASRSPTFSKACIALATPHLTEKLGDMKLKKPASDALMVFAEKSSLSFVLGLAYDPLNKQKAPKMLADSIVWINSALVDFGISGLALRALIEFLKQALKNSNAAVRSSATAALVTLRLFAGTGIKDFLEDLNPQLLTTIQAEFDKVEGQSAPVPTRTSADVVLSSAAGSGGKAKGATSGDPLDDLFPRVDLEKLVSATSILADAKSEAWKTRKEALEGLLAILEVGTNKRLKPNLGDIAQMLKARLADINKLVQGHALDIVARIATGMNRPFEKYSRILVLPVAQVMADQKANIRASACTTLTAIANACEGIDSMAHFIGTALESTNPLLRTTLFGWIDGWLKENRFSSSTDVSNWVPSSADVRKGATSILPVVIAHVGVDYVIEKTNALKPASRSASTTPASEEATAPAAAPSRKGLLSRRLGAASPRPASRAENEPEPPSPGGSLGMIKKGHALKRPLSVSAKPPTPVLSSSDSLPFITGSPDPKRGRLAKDGSRWVIESGPSRKDLVEALQHQMETHASQELLSLLFSHDHNAVNDHIAGLTMICDCYTSTAAGEESFGVSIEEAKAILIANADLPLKYVSTKIHEPQPNLMNKCLDVVDSLGDARELIRNRVQTIMQTLPKVFSSSRLFSLLLEHGLRSKVAKTRQGALDEMANIIKKKGVAVCDPSKALPLVAAAVNDKDPSVRKSALSVIGECYTLEGDKVWNHIGRLDPKAQTQVEEKLKRLPTPSKTPAGLESSAIPSISRVASARPGSPLALPRRGSVNAPSPAGVSRLSRPMSPPSSPLARSTTPVMSRTGSPPTSPARTQTNGAGPSSPTRPKGGPASRLAAPRTRPQSISSGLPPPGSRTQTLRAPSVDMSKQHSRSNLSDPRAPDELNGQDEITITISSILSSDPARSVEALKKIQKILDVPLDMEHTSLEFQNLANHTDGLVETITLQMAHVFDRSEGIAEPQNYRLAKHLIQTLNAFCDHWYSGRDASCGHLNFTAGELTTRLLQTDESQDSKVKDLSRFINMIILRLFATGRRIHVFRALFNLLLHITKGFTAKGTSPQSRDAKLAELVLKCMWKLARGIPADLEKGVLDPVEIFPALEAFLQTIPPNEWRARAASKVPCGDMPLRTIKVVIQHVVGAFGDEVYDQLSASFDDPSATIVYPYVYRILNSAAAVARPLSAGSTAPSLAPSTSGRSSVVIPPRSESPEYPAVSTRRQMSSSSSLSSAFNINRERSDSAMSNSVTSGRDTSPPTPIVAEPDPDTKLIEIIGHISSETTGALHKEGITELHHFLKAYPQKRPKVDKMLDATGPQFRKYLARALASRAAEDEDRRGDTLSRLESSQPVSEPTSPRSSIVSTAARRISGPADGSPDDRALSRLHDIFRYQGRSSVVLDSRRASVTSSARPDSPTTDMANQRLEAARNVV
ncbi:hypothetical protein BS47DRAFT_1370532 [Hydnum rufescens UP504]|uniref:TOG domain-containing protein n=1 Tax=Hydnum rufescens UP504 TaxID=1448309 RepID=A0A9P6DYY5_9AGAM|nr:hypothetical protein BS47DRAFT_1370532 [Hydnum rufescens UP504]